MLPQVQSPTLHTIITENVPAPKVVVPVKIVNIVNIAQKMVEPVEFANNQTIMKKLILLNVLLFSLIIQAQNQNIINKMVESKTIEDLKVVANDIASKSKTKYEFYNIFRYSVPKGESYQYLVYNKATMSEVEKKELASNSFKNCLVIKFGEWNKGENTDLAIKGDLVYFFKEVTSKYLDLDEFWISTFCPGTSPEELINNYKLKEFRVNKDLKYKFVKNDETWTISKSY